MENMLESREQPWAPAPLSIARFVARWTAATCAGWLLALLAVMSPVFSRQAFVSGIPEYRDAAAGAAAILAIALVTSVAQAWALKPSTREPALWIAASMAGAIAAMGLGIAFLPSGLASTIVYPVLTAIPMAIAQAAALLHMSGHKVLAGLWLVMRLVLVSVVSFVGGFVVTLSIAGLGPGVWKWPLAMTLVAGLPSALASGLYLAFVVRPVVDRRVQA